MLATMCKTATKFSCKCVSSCDMAAVSEDRPSGSSGMYATPSHSQLEGDEIQATCTPTDSTPGK